MATADSIVGQPAQPAASGWAQVFPGRSPFAVLPLLERRAFRMQREEMQRNALKQQRLKTFSDAMKYNPDAVMTPYQDYVKGMVSGFYDSARGELERTNMDPGADSLTNIESIKSNITGTVGKIRQYEKELLGINNRFSKDKQVNQNALNERLYDTIYDREGNLLPPEQLDIDRLNSVMSDASIYNVNQIAKDFADNIAEEELTEMSNLGDAFNEEKYKFKFVKTDNDGKPVYENGRPVIEVTDELLWRAKADERMSLFIDDYMEKGRATDEKDALEQIIQDNAYAKREQGLKSNPIAAAKYRNSGSEKNYQVNYAISDGKTYQVGDSMSEGQMGSHYAPFALGVVRKDQKPITVNTVPQTVFDPVSGKTVLDNSRQFNLEVTEVFPVLKNKYTDMIIPLGSQREIDQIMSGRYRNQSVNPNDFDIDIMVRGANKVNLKDYDLERIAPEKHKQFLDAAKGDETSDLYINAKADYLKNQKGIQKEIFARLEEMPTVKAAMTGALNSGDYQQRLNSFRQLLSDAQNSYQTPTTTNTGTFDDF
ncbi:MAG: hypothetical protein F6K19_01365 [Cyanothece sp. SIO1E1]|nr:hypothetical protein [Cyanothece sp. SIO1E1]